MLARLQHIIAFPRSHQVGTHHVNQYYSLSMKLNSHQTNYLTPWSSGTAPPLCGSCHRSMIFCEAPSCCTIRIFLCRLAGLARHDCFTDNKIEITERFLQIFHTHRSTHANRHTQAFVPHQQINIIFAFTIDEQ